MSDVKQILELVKLCCFCCCCCFINFCAPRLCGAGGDNVGTNDIQFVSLCHIWIQDTPSMKGSCHVVRRRLLPTILHLT